VADREIWQRFAEIERKLTKLYEHLGIDMPDAPSADEVSEEVKGLIREDKLVQAVKLHKDQTGISLPEAKDAIDSLRGRV
jgi:ribosomal protein L7/L12